MKMIYSKLSTCDHIVDSEKKMDSCNNTLLDESKRNRLKNYNLNEYIEDVQQNGLDSTWNYICQYVLDSKSIIPKFLQIDNFGELYEIGLATQDKFLKKKNGQYFTPDDVAQLMCTWLELCNGVAVCDVGCGTGKLILTYLSLIGYENARNLIKSGNLYLYEIDRTALQICKTIIAIKYGQDISKNIHDNLCDFLNTEILLPDNCKVISNPPYSQISELKHSWCCTEIMWDSKEYYAFFMEKIISQSNSAVILTPFSFISGKKFYSLREFMCREGHGKIFSFDNVPGNIFSGRKHGVFNTNTANSVRAAITVFNRDSITKGFKVSPLIRFKNNQRNELLIAKKLDSLLPDKYQVINKKNTMFKKIDNQFEEIFNSWVEQSNILVKDVLSSTETDLMIDMPNTCRYYTTASSKKLNRTGSIILYLTDIDVYNFLYCLINSSFVYLWWRVFDGGITYPKNLLKNVPLPMNMLTNEDKLFFSQMCQKLKNDEKKYIIKKVNAGVEQENIKFPENYRKEINNRILSILGFDAEDSTFDGIHSNEFCFKRKN